jgi:hypothetical protein
MRVPKFKSTNEAIAYGKSCRGNLLLTQQLREALAVQDFLTDQVQKIENPDDEMIQIGMDYAVAGQFLREALAVANGADYDNIIKKIQEKRSPENNSL